MLDRLLVWLGVSPGSIVSGHVAATLGLVPLGNSLSLDSNDKSISVVTRYSDSAVSESDPSPILLHCQQEQQDFSFSHKNIKNWLYWRGSHVESTF